MIQRVYVTVYAVFDERGNMRPSSLVWKGEKRYMIDKVTQLHHMREMDRYTVIIGGKQRYLFFETKIRRWYVERALSIVC